MVKNVWNVNQEHSGILVHLNVYHVQVVVSIINKINFVNVQQINFGHKQHVLLAIYLNISILIWKNVLIVHLVWLMIFHKICVLIVLLINLILMDLNVQHVKVLLIIVQNFEHVQVVHMEEYIINKVSNVNAQQESSSLVLVVSSVIILSTSIWIKRNV